MSGITNHKRVDRPESFTGWFRRYMLRVGDIHRDGKGHFGFVNGTTVEIAARAAWNAATRQANRK